MRIRQYAKIIFMILAIVASSFLIPVLVAVYKREMKVLPAFLIPMAVVFLCTAVFFFSDSKKIKLSTKGGIILTALAWVCAGLLGAFPLYISKAVPSFTDAMFEAISGFTTTGATIMTNIDKCPISIHVWRTQMHWLGGMGIVALTVALFPLLGIGGFRLIKSETSGPDKGKITSKITHTAKALWFIYFGMTVLQIILLKIAGMSFIDSMCHTFSSLGTGGFSTKGGSVGAFGSASVDIICIVFMLAAGVNFTLYFRLFTGYPSDIVNNSEFKAYIKVVLCAVIIITIAICPIYGLPLAMRHAFFQVASIITTTGFSTVDYDLWPEIAKFVLLLLMFTGGCSGSTAGGIKIIRWVILKKQANNEMKRLLQPHGIFSIQLNNRPGRKDVVYSVAGFIFCYLLLVVITCFAAIFNGIDVFSGLSASLAIVGNVGLGFGPVGPSGNFAFFSPATKWLFCFSMLAGRLELYTMIIYFSPVFWRN